MLPAQPKERRRTLDPRDAVERLTRLVNDQASLREAADAAVQAIVQRFGEHRRTEVHSAVYSVEEVTWPVSRDPAGASAFATPVPVPALIRNDVVLSDVRARYWDGMYDYDMVGDKIGRWRRFRTGSPGDRGYDLRLPTDEDRRAFAREAPALLEVLNGEEKAPAD